MNTAYNSNATLAAARALADDKSPEADVVRQVMNGYSSYYYDCTASMLEVIANADETEDYYDLAQDAAPSLYYTSQVADFYTRFPHEVDEAIKEYGEITVSDAANIGFSNAFRDIVLAIADALAEFGNDN